MSELSLRVVTPNGSHGPFECDSIHVNVCDSVFGKGGGEYGIRKGHAKAVLSLNDGKLFAKKEGKTVFSAHCGSGFAMVDQNKVSVVVEECML